LQALALSCEDAVDDCAGLVCGAFAASIEVRLIANKSEIIGAHTWREILDKDNLLRSQFAAT